MQLPCDLRYDLGALTWLRSSRRPYSLCTLHLFFSSVSPSTVSRADLSSLSPETSEYESPTSPLSPSGSEDLPATPNTTLSTSHPTSYDSDPALLHYRLHHLQPLLRSRARRTRRVLSLRVPSPRCTSRSVARCSRGKGVCLQFHGRVALRRRYSTRTTMSWWRRVRARRRFPSARAPSPRGTSRRSWRKTGMDVADFTTAWRRLQGLRRG
ncbi:hypothetical protein B0H12DRAFT_309194 [Mycena haematopus]|nr:hypothetical protein B0H12DRAFT_309194 [Mycena haematopus]